MRFIVTLLLSAVLLVSNVHAACKSGNSASFDPSDTTNRLLSFTPANPANVADYATANLVVSNFNIQSGLSINCQLNLEAQFQSLVAPQYFAMQEVDIDTTYCKCSQPQLAANITGKATRYLRLVNTEGGLYGHASGTVYPILDSRHKLYDSYSSELRGLIAIRTQPPQLAGRDLWLVSTHYQFDSVETRTQQATEFVNFVQGLVSEFPQALIIAPGDMYVQFGDPDYAVMSSYFNDSWVQFSGVQTGGSTYPSTNPVSRDDYIWYKAPANFPVTIENYEVNTSPISDHAKLTVTFRFPSVAAPTIAPTLAPTFAPTTGESTTGAEPTPAPTPAPTATPTATPTVAPTRPPTPVPNPVCNAFYRVEQRAGGSYVSDGTEFSVYDIIIVNNGTCSLSSATITANIPATEVWNFDAASGVVNIYGSIGAGQSYSGAGFIAKSGYSADPSAFTTTCSDTCSKTVTPPEISKCNLMVEASPRVASGKWTTDGVDYQIFDFSATNYGDSSAFNIMFFIQHPSSYKVTQSWNLPVVSSSNAQRIVEFDLFGTKLAPGSSFSMTSGVIISAPSPIDNSLVKASLAGVSC